MKEHLKYINAEDYRVPRERMVLYFSMGCLVFIFIILFIAPIIPIIILVLSIAMVKIRQGQLLGQSVKVSEYQLPKVYNAIKVAAERLSMEIPDVFVKQDPFINAYALGFLGKKSVVLHSKTVEVMSTNELISVLGHEFSHIKCYHTNWIVITNSSEGIRVPIISDIMGFIFLMWSRKAELTADRGGLLASRNLKSTISALAKITVGEELYKDLNLDKFIDQQKQIDENIIAKMAQMLATHPYTVKRMQALDIFFKSKKYKKLIKEHIPPKDNSHVEDWWRDQTLQNNILLLFLVLLPIS